METAGPLGRLQRLWLGFAAGIAAITVVAVVGGEGASELPAALPAALAAAAGVGALVGVVAVDRTFAAAPPPDDLAALAELRTRAYLQVAIAEAPVLLAFVLAFVLGPPWVAVIGGISGLLALAAARPTRGRIGRIEAAWHRAGADVSALRAVDDHALGADHPETTRDHAADRLDGEHDGDTDHLDADHDLDADDLDADHLGADRDASQDAGGSPSRHAKGR